MHINVVSLTKSLLRSWHTEMIHLTNTYHLINYNIHYFQVCNLLWFERQYQATPKKLTYSVLFNISRATCVESLSAFVNKPLYAIYSSIDRYPCKLLPPLGRYNNSLPEGGKRLRRRLSVCEKNIHTKTVFSIDLFTPGNSKRQILNFTRHFDSETLTIHIQDKMQNDKS